MIGQNIYMYFFVIGGNRNGSFGNRNRRSNSNLSAEQLDAELDEYRAKGL